MSQTLKSYTDSDGDRVLFIYDSLPDDPEDVYVLVVNDSEGRDDSRRAVVRIPGSLLSELLVSYWAAKPSPERNEAALGGLDTQS